MGIWEIFDQRLYSLKYEELCHELHEKTEAARRRVLFEHRKSGQGEGVGLYAKLVDSDLSVLREHLEGVDRICREVWEIQGKAIAPDFIRAMRDNAIFPTIADRAGEIGASLQLMAQRTRFTDLNPVLDHLARERGQLESRLSNRYEIEARELELKNAERAREREREGAPKVRRATQALPPPIDPIRGGFYTHSGPKPTQAPTDLPPNYPNDLKPRTDVIVAEAVRKFPDQTHTLELCKHVISKMTPLFRAAVQTGTMRADLALSDCGMGGLLHSLLVYNCDNGDERFRLEQEVRKSDEWLNLAKRIERITAGVNTKQPRTLEFTPHVPLSNPLTANDAGSSATINIASFSMRLAGYEDVGYNSGSITGLAYNTLYYVYFDQVPPVGALEPPGGTVSYEATTTKLTVILVAGRFFVGSILTPAKGGLPTIGNGDGGTFQMPEGQPPVLKSPHEPKAAMASVDLDAKQTNERESFVSPILAEKGWSILDWATHSNVDFHTADNYLKGKTKPYKSTRTKLAKSLGVEVQKLPG